MSYCDGLKINWVRNLAKPRLISYGQKQNKTKQNKNKKQTNKKQKQKNRSSRIERSYFSDINIV